MARYIERAEDVARLINVNMNLQLDLPKKVRTGWQPLIDITGSTKLFAELHDNSDERTVVRFLMGEQQNPGSIISALIQARENARTIRDIIPREAWEQVNDLYLKAKNDVQSGLSQRGRYDYLRSIILGAQTITGQLAGTMTHDHGYDFLRIGRNLERADMTTRIIDVRTATLLPERLGDLAPFENIQWMSVLKSLTGYQMYRRQMQVRVNRADVLEFLFKDAQFPRTLRHCVGEVEDCLRHLPRSDELRKTTAHIQETLEAVDTSKFDETKLHKMLDKFQLTLGDLHNQISTTYFSLERKPPAKAKSAESGSGKAKKTA
jgi:uncharacterized alpha-E superfamily protein